MYCGYLVDKGNKSSTLKSYLSAIKLLLKIDGYEWNDNRVALGSLIKACKIRNDVINCRFTIQKGLFEILLFELEKIFDKSPYLSILDKAMFILRYYRLMRVGELTLSSHVLKAANVHIGENKNKILLILYTSKTHSRANYPQHIKITAVDMRCNSSDGRKDMVRNVLFCPFQLVHNYLHVRGGYVASSEPFFVFRDRTPVKANNFREVLCSSICQVNLDPKLYNCHSLHIGRNCDLFRGGMPVQNIMKLGCWRSNAVYKYLHD